MILTIKKYAILFFFLLISVVHAGYNDLILTPKFKYSTGEPYQGNFDISIGFVTYNTYVDSFICPYLNPVKGVSICTENINVSINNGFAVIKLENMTDLDAFITSNLQLKFQQKQTGFSDIYYADISSSLTKGYELESSAYSILSWGTAFVELPEAERLVSSSVFNKPFLVNDGLDFGEIEVSNVRPFISARNQSNEFDIDFDGIINVTANGLESTGSDVYFSDGVPFSDTFSWIYNSTNHDLYIDDNKKIAIARDFIEGQPVGAPNFDLQVYGKVLASDYYFKDVALRYVSDWVTSNEGFLYYKYSTQNVGFFGQHDEELDLFLPEKLNVAGVLMTGNVGTPTSGSIYVKDDDVVGVLDDANTISTFNTIQIEDASYQLSFFKDSQRLGSDGKTTVLNNDFYSSVSLFNPDGSLLRLKDDMVIVSADNQVLFGVNSVSGNVVVSKNSDNSIFVDVLGSFDAQEYYMKGLPIQLQMAQGEYFYKNVLDSSPDNLLVYYDRGYVSFGVFESNDSRSVLEIGSPFLEPNQSFIDPVISFSRKDGAGNDTIFSMGVSSLYDDQFMIVDGYDLNVEDPLISIKRNYLGIGTNQVNANLHILGNLGVLIEGDLQFFDDVDRERVYSVFGQPGNRMYFNPYSASFRAGQFFSSNNYHQNVGVFSAAIGVSHQVSGNVSSVLGGVNSDVSGFYSSVMGGFSNDVSHGFSFALGIGSQIDHHGSFVFSHGGYYTDGSYDLNSLPEVITSNRLRTLDSRQFLIGAPSSSVISSFVGVNTAIPDAVLTVKSKSVFPSILVDELAISLEDANVLFDGLVSHQFLNNHGDLKVYDKRYFNEHYTVDFFPLIVTINSVQVFEDLVATINDQVGSYWDQNPVISTDDLVDWNIITANLDFDYDYGINDATWGYHYKPRMDNKAWHDSDNNSAFMDMNIGGRFHTRFVSMNISETISAIRDDFVDKDLFSGQEYFFSCNKDSNGDFHGYNDDENGDPPYNAGSTENFIIAVVNNFYPSDEYSDGYIVKTASERVSTLDLKEWMMDALNKPGVTCEDWSGLTVDLALMAETIITKDVSIFCNDYVEGGGNNFGTVECRDHADPRPVYDTSECETISSDVNDVRCKYTYSAYSTYLKDVVYPALLDNIRADMARYLIDSFDFDNVSTGSYLISDFDNVIKDDICGNGSPDLCNVISVEDVQVVLEKFVTSNIFTLRDADGDIKFQVENDGNVGIGYDDVDRADLAVRGSFYITEPAFTNDIVSKSMSTVIDDFQDLDLPALVMDNYYDSSESYDGVLTYPASLFVRTLPQSYQVTPSFMVASNGNVAVGARVTTETYSLEILGESEAAGFTTPAGDLSPEVVIVFESEDTTPNIYFLDGFLGLGFVTPNRPTSLLHLTYYDGNSVPNPLIGFDYNDYDLLHVGGMTPAFPGFRMGDLDSIYDEPALFVSSNQSLVDGVPGFFSSEAGVVSGSVGVSSGFMFVNTNNVTSSEFSTDDLFTQFLFVRKNNEFIKVSSSGFPWNFDYDQRLIYLDDGTLIGIGTTEPSYDLHVSGNFNFMDNNTHTFSVLNSLFTNQLYLTTKNYRSVEDVYLQFDNNYIDLKLLVKSEDLYLSINDNVFNQSDQISSGTGSCGDLMIWKDFNELYQSGFHGFNSSLCSGAISDDGYPLPTVNFVFDFNDVTNNYWSYVDPDPADSNFGTWVVAASGTELITENMSRLAVTGNFNIQVDNLVDVTGVSTANNHFIFPYSLDSVFYGAYLQSSLRHNGDFWTDSFSHSFTSLNMVLQDKEFHNESSIYGFNINLNNIDRDGNIKTLVEGSEAIGLYSDLRNVVVQESGIDTRGYAFSGIFMGDVVIATTNLNANVSRSLSVLTDETDPNKPTYNHMLAIQGTMISDDLVISKALYTPTLYVNAGYSRSFNVGNDGSVPPKPRVGIDVLNPINELDVGGDVVSNYIDLGNLTSDYLIHTGDVFTILSTGFVGFGKTVPHQDEDLLFYKLFDSYNFPTFNYKFYSFDVSNNIELTTDLTGLHVNIITSENNFVGLNDLVTVKGVEIDLTGTNSSTTANVYGLYVDVVVSDNSYSALFMTGNVGIGVSEPEVALHIMGDIRTVDYEGIESEVNDLNNLEIDSLTVFDDSDMFDVSAQRVTVDTLVFSNTIDFDFSNVNVANLSLDVSGITSVNILNDITTLNNSTGTLEVFETLLGQKGYIGRIKSDVNDITYALDVGLDLKAPSINFVSVSPTDIVQAGSLLVSNNVGNEIDYVASLMVDEGYFYVNDSVPDIGYRYPVSVRVDVTTNLFIATDNRTWNSVGLFSGVTDNNSYVAASLYPHRDDEEHWMLLSKLWNSQDNAGILTQAELDLAFYNFDSDSETLLDFTDIDSNNFKSPALYVSSNGHVLLSPARTDIMRSDIASFNVYGTSRFLDMVDITTLKVDDIFSDGSITIGKALERIIFDDPVTLNNDLFVQDTVAMRGITANIISGDYPMYDMYINQADSVALYLVTQNGVPTADLWVNLNFSGKVISSNLTTALPSRANSVFMFSDGGVVTPSNLMVTNNNGNKIYFNDGSINHRMVFNGAVSSENTYLGDVELYSLDVDIDTSLSSRTIQGLIVDVASANIQGAAIGVAVSMNVNSEYGKKFPALFSGGTVLISSINRGVNTTYSQPSANLHIASHNNMLSNAMKLDNTQFYSLSVSDNKVGLGTSYDAMFDGLLSLDIQYLNLNNGDSIVRIEDNNNLLFNVAVLTRNTSVLVETDSFESLTTSNFTKLTTDRLTMAMGNVISFNEDSGFVGMKIDEPLAQFHAKDVLTELAIVKDRKAIYMGVSLNPAGNFSGGNMTGLDIDLKAVDNNQLDNGTVKGLDVDMTSFSVHNDSVVYGLYVDTPASVTGSLVFVTGNVGIGLTEPEHALDMDGILYVDGDVLTVSSNIYLNVDGGATVNTLYVNDALAISQPVEWTSVSVNALQFVNLISNGETITDFDFSAFFQSPGLDIQIMKLVAGNFYVSKNVTFFIGTSNFSLSNTPAILIDTGANRAYMENLFVTSDVNIETLGSYSNDGGYIEFRNDVTFNQGIVNQMTVPNFSFGVTKDHRIGALIVTDNFLYFGFSNGSKNKLALSPQADYRIPMQTDNEGLTSNAGLKVVINNNLNDFVEVSRNVLMNALVDSDTDFPNNGLQDMLFTILYRGPSEIDYSNPLHAVGLQVVIATSNVNTLDVSNRIEGVSINMQNLFADYYLGDGTVADIGKYAAIFEGGRVAIFPSSNSTIPTPNDTDVYVSSNIDVDQFTNKKFFDFFVEGLSDDSEGRGFAVGTTVGGGLYNSYVDIGITRNINNQQLRVTGSLVRVSANDNKLMRVYADGLNSARNLFSIENNQVYIGPVSTSSTASFNVQGSGPDDLLVSLNNILFVDTGVSIVSDNTRTYLDRVALLDLMTDSNEEVYLDFWSNVSTSKEDVAMISSNMFTVGKFNQVAKLPDYTRLAIKGDPSQSQSDVFLVGDLEAANVQQAGNDLDLGFVVSRNEYLSLVVSDNETKAYFKYNSDVFKMQSGNDLFPVLAIASESIGIFHVPTNEEYNLVVDRRVESQHYLAVVSDNENYYDFIVDSNGYVGIGVSVNQDLSLDQDFSSGLVVNGKVRIETIDNTNSANSSLLVNDDFIISGTLTDSKVNNLTLLTEAKRFDESFTGMSVLSQLAMDVTKNNVFGYRVAISDTVQPSGAMYGLYADVASLDAKILEGSNKYAGVFYGQTAGFLDSKVVIDLVPTSDYSVVLHKKSACSENQMHSQDISVSSYPCLNNINYFYPLSVITSKNNDVGNEYVNFNTVIANESSPFTSFSIIAADSTANNKVVDKDTSDINIYKYKLSGYNFMNTIPNDINGANAARLQEYLNAIVEVLDSERVLDSEGQLASSFVSSAIHGYNFPVVDPNNQTLVHDNVLAVLENFSTQNVFLWRHEYNDIQTVDDVCLVVGNIWGIDNPDPSVDCVHKNVLAQSNSQSHTISGTTEYGNIMYPIAFSSGLEPLYMEPYNVARVGINLLTTANDFEQGNVEFTDTLIVGEGSRGFNKLPSNDNDSAISNYDYIESGDTGPSCIAPDDFLSWKKEKGFFEDMDTYVERFQSGTGTNCASTMTSENIHEYVEKDQHSITVRSLASGATKYRYMSYKTRFDDVRLGQYMPKSNFGESNSVAAKLYFSGGTCIDSSLITEDDCSDNLDVFTMGRQNQLPIERLEDGFLVKSYGSLLKVDLQEKNSAGDDIQFQIGFTDTSGEFSAPLIAGVDTGTTFVGIGSLWNEYIRPKAVLHVKDFSVSSGGSYFEYLTTSGLSAERFVYASDATLKEDFSSVYHSVDQHGFPTNIRTAAEEGAGCDGDYRVYNNKDLWDEATSFNYTTGDCDNGGDGCEYKPNPNYISPEDTTISNPIFHRTIGLPADNTYTNVNAVISGTSVAHDDFDNVLFTSSHESVYSCNYFAWLVRDVLGYSYNEVASTNHNLQSIGQGLIPYDTDNPNLQCSSKKFSIFLWDKFVEKWNLGCFNDRLSQKGVKSPSLLKLSKDTRRFVPKAHSAVLQAAAYITTYDDGEYLNYGFINGLNCKQTSGSPDTHLHADIFDWSNWEGVSTDNWTVDQKANWKAIMELAEADAHSNIDAVDNALLFNECRTTFVNPVRIARDSDDLFTRDFLAEFDTTNSQRSILALNYPTTAISESTNFISFFFGNTLTDQVALGEIEGLESSVSGQVNGIQFSSPGRDYAEYMIKKDPNQDMRSGDVVGVYGGELSFDTDGADAIMVISSAPIIVGNFPGDDVKHLYELIAFLGQVPVKVSGDVNPGDILIASGKEDGMAIAIHEDNLLPNHLPFIIGRAWEGYSGDDTAYINTLIGFSFNADIINRYIDKAAKTLSNEVESTKELEIQLKLQLKQQQDLIERLEKALTMNKE